MDSFTGKDSRTFLEAVDRNLKASAEAILLGGGAAALAYGVQSTTEDIDSYNTLTKPVLPHQKWKKLWKVGLGRCFSTFRA
jgi:hypothetical protein